MTAPNHIIGGFTFTGIFASILGINILQDYRLLPVIFLASLLPDIDHTKSIIGKAFYPIAHAINRKYGHRTITHSLIVLIALTALIGGIQAAYFPSIPIATVFGLAYGSHLLFDMMTVQGVPLFYPFRKNACVIPGNPHMRLRTHNIRQETAVFCFFLVSAVFLKPLFANGFWTSYNSLFGTLKHIVSEYNKSDDLMIVHFTVQHGSEISDKEGLCIDVSSSDITILNRKKKWESYPQDGQLIRDIYPTHTKMKYSFEQGQFHDISIDSMHRLFRSGKYTMIEIHGNDRFIHLNNGIAQQTQNLTLDYPNELILREIPDDKEIDFTANPTIQLKLHDLQMYRTKQREEQTRYENESAVYTAKKAKIEQETDVIRKELLMIEFSKLKTPTLPTGYRDRINRLQNEIAQMRKEDERKYTKALKDAEKDPLRLSGSWERVLINGKNL